MKTPESPLPWRVELSLPADLGLPAVYHLVDSQGRFLAMGPLREELAYAAHASSYYPRLLEALEECAGVLYSFYDNAESSRAGWAYDEVRRLIKEAKGETG